MSQIDPAQESLRHWSVVAPAWEAYRDRLFENTRSVSEWLVDQVDPHAGQTVLELTAGPGETGFLAAPRLGPGNRLPRAFIRCTGGDLDIGGDPIEPMAAKARTEGWLYQELPAPHDPHLFDPDGTAAILHELAAFAVTNPPTSTVTSA